MKMFTGPENCYKDFEGFSQIQNYSFPKHIKQRNKRHGWKFNMRASVSELKCKDIRGSAATFNFEADDSSGEAACRTKESSLPSYQR